MDDRLCEQLLQERARKKQTRLAAGLVPSYSLQSDPHVLAAQCDVEMLAEALTLLGERKAVVKSAFILASAREWDEQQKRKK